MFDSLSKFCNFVLQMSYLVFRLGKWCIETLLPGVNREKLTTCITHFNAINSIL